jgi:heme A synthase
MSEDSLTTTSVIFIFGFPALLLILGYVAYFLSFNYFSIEMHDVGLAFMVLGIIFYCIVAIAKGLGEPEDQLTELKAISTVFAYGIPALLIILGVITYFRGVPTGMSELTNLGLALFIVGIIFYFIEIVARLVQRFSTPE